MTSQGILRSAAGIRQGFRVRPAAGAFHRHGWVPFEDVIETGRLRLNLPELTADLALSIIYDDAFSEHAQQHKHKQRLEALVAYLPAGGKFEP